ncbi:MAG: ABC transporter ATP-binding protein [Ignavibacteria bacterium]|nr:ABC transporter ATP-binding protein [Ignavibacteria bacterium]MBI3765362.1 ABC transporter ATP-binding protein [Ignavibacteriales bacterium]
MSIVNLIASDLTKFFNRRKIFSDISFTLHYGSSVAITGRNGSGKSTLLKILAGVLSSTKGEVDIQIDGKDIDLEHRHQIVGFVSPYLQMYDEFTGWENLDLFRRVRGVDVRDELLLDLIRRVNLFDRRNDFVRTYSSGMKQRLKYAFALLHRPPILFLDEPSANLDNEGIATVYDMMEEQKQKGILVVATNVAAEQSHCEFVLDLNSGSPIMVGQ